MYQASKYFGDAIAGPNRKFNTRLLENEKVLVESVKNFTITSGAEEITIGSAVASYVQATIENKGIALSGKEVSLEIGVEVDGDMEYIPMGLYTIQNPKIESNKVTFTAYDRLASRCNGAYYSKLGYPVDAVDILAEISTMTGVAIDTPTLQRGIQINQRAIIEEGDYNEETEESEVITTYVNPFDGYTYKETIGFIAGLFGKFAICGRTGMIEFRWYQGIDYEIPSNIFYNDLQETEESFSIKRLTCDNSDQTLSSGSGATGISMQNPVMTQSILDGVYNTVQGLVFTPAALRFIGDMRLDIGDIVTAVKNDGTKFTIPIISLITSYDGGLMQTIASYGNTAEEDDSDTKGPITEMAERVEYELAFVKKLMVDNLTATNATIKNLSGDVLKFKTGEFENLKSDVASFKETTTTNLNAANAKIENLEANTVKTSELEAKVGTFGYLKATDASLTYATITNLKAESGKIDDLQSDYATFKTATANDLKAANANIQNLTATKATITDLNAATAKISILEGNYANLNTLVNGNLTSANIQSLTLNSKNTTIENGMIKNAMIENLAFDKITGMDINTTNLTVHSSDGKSKWSDNTIQISDANRVRVQIGKDASNDYSMSVWDKDGKLIWDALGATENTIQRKIIRDNVVADNANISGSKLDINSVVREVNGSTTKLKSSVINMNDKNQTLDVVFNELATTVDEIEVGGRNLLLYSKEPKKHTDFYSVGWFTSEEGTYNGCSTMTTTSRWGRLTILFKKHIIDRELAKVGDVFTYSIYARTNNTSGKQINCSYRVINKVNAGWFKDKTDAITTEWKQVYVTFTITEDMLADNSYLNQIGFEVTSEMTSGDKVYFACPKLEKGNKATDWTPAHEDTQSQIDNISEITTSHTTSISTMQGQISSLISEDTTIKGNYDTLVSKYNSTVETVNGMKTTIGEHTSSINNVSSKITTIEANLSDITTRVSASEEKFDNLQIGGRNLIRNSNFTYGTKYITSESGAINIIDSAIYGKALTVTPVVGKRIFWETKNVWNNSTYTVSFVAKSSVAGQKIRPSRSVADWGEDLTLTTEYKRYVTQIKTTVTVDGGTLSFSFSNAVGAITLTDVKLEKGNKATDYTPAPEDVNGKIQSVETIATQTAKKFEWIVKGGDSSSNFTLTDRVADLVADRINFKGLVTFSGLNTDAKNEIGKVAQSKVDGLEVGGRNLLKCSSMIGEKLVCDNYFICNNCDTKEYTNEGFHIITPTEGNANNGIVFSFDNFTILGINGGDTITFSCDIKGTSDSHAPFVSIHISDNNWCGSDVIKKHTWVSITKDWQRVSVTITTPTGLTKNHMWLAIHGNYQSDLYVRNFKLEKGNKATDWTPAPEDVSQDATNKASQALTDAKNYSSNAVNWVTSNGASTTSLNSMVKKWTDGAVSDTTQINGGWIKANTITASKIAVGDFTNYCQLNKDTASSYGFTATDDTKGVWFTASPIDRDKDISQWFTCEGSQKLYVEYDLSTTVKGKVNASDTGTSYLTSGIMIFAANGTKEIISYTRSKGVTATSDGTVTHISLVETLPADARFFRVVLQTNGKRNTFSGTLKIRDPQVRKATTGKLIVDGSITANKIATDAIKSRGYVANSTGSFLNLKDGSFDSKYLKWDASGNITAKGGTIGKYKITDQWLITGSGSTCTGIGGNQAFWAGADSSDSAPFRVGYDGKFVSSNADISGKIGATSGTIGKYEITDTYLKTGSGSTCSGFGSDYAFWAGNDEAKYAPFRVEYDGTLNIEHITVHGNQEDVYMKIGKDFLTIQDVNTSAHFGLDGFDFAWANSRIRTGDQGIELYGDTPYIDFHYNNSYADYTSRIIAQSNWDCLSFTGSILLGGYIYNSSNGHYTWDGRTDAYLGCGNYNNTNNIYYYAGYHAFYVNGDSGSGMMYIETSGVSSRKGFRNSSDERIKKDFKHFDDDFINSYMQLEPVKYRFKDDSDDKYHIGFKAQNVDKTLNTYGKKHDEQFGICVASHINQDYAEKAYGIENMNEVYTLAYDELIGANTFMIQKTRKDLLYQAGKIDIHEAIINDLQFKIAKMEKKIEQLTKALA